MKWFRCYNEITRDRKLRRHSPAVRWVWITLLSMANESPQRGLVLLSDGIPATVEDIADEAAVSKKEVEEALAVFSEQKQIENVGDTWKVIKWDNRQFAKDDVSFRVQKHRDRKNVTPLKHSNGVSGNTDVTPPDTDTDTDIIIPPTPFLKKETSEDRSDVKTIDELVEHLQRKHPGYRKRWSLEGIVKFRQVASQKIEDGWTPDELHCHIEYYRPGCEGYSLFEIFDKKHQDRPSFGPYLTHKTQEELDKWIHSATH